MIKQDKCTFIQPISVSGCGYNEGLYTEFRCCDVFNMAFIMIVSVPLFIRLPLAKQRIVSMCTMIITNKQKV